MVGWSAVGVGVETNFGTNEEAGGSRWVELMWLEVEVTVAVTRAVTEVGGVR